MIKYPLAFEVKAFSESDMARRWHAQASGREIACAIPPEFEGVGGGLSPEDLYALAAANCFIATFKVFASKSRLEYGAIQVGTQLIVDRGEGGRPEMSRLNFKVVLIGAKDPERAKYLLQKVSESCLVLNALKSEKHFEFLLAGRAEEVHPETLQFPQQWAGI
jgi:organic hydroperoxide reductase OsmC/OhrA